MSLHNELLVTAKRLIAAATPTDADLRRSISTAYYALFHRLVDAAVCQLLSIHTVDQQAGVARHFDHTKMRDICRKIVPLGPPTQTLTPHARILGLPIPQQLKAIARAFDELQQRRSEADYDRNPSHRPITLTTAQQAISMVETAFADWTAIESTPAAQAFLVLLLIDPKSR